MPKRREKLKRPRGYPGLYQRTPSGQFFVADIMDGPQFEVPVDNFYWKTNRGEVVKLEMSGGRVYVTGQRKELQFEEVSDALRAMADILEKKRKQKH